MIEHATEFGAIIGELDEGRARKRDDALCAQLAERSERVTHLELGRSHEGRPIPLLVVAEEPVTVREEIVTTSPDVAAAGMPPANGEQQRVVRRVPTTRRVAYTVAYQRTHTSGDELQLEADGRFTLYDVPPGVRVSIGFDSGEAVRLG